MPKTRRRKYAKCVPHYTTEALKLQMDEASKKHDVGISDILRAGSVLAMQLLEEKGRDALFSVSV